MSDVITYALEDGVATIAVDDGKVNALSPATSEALLAALDRAAADEAVVVLTGRAATFSAGFDLRVPGEQWPAMLVAGARVAERLLTFPRPTVIACNGNAVAMGALLLLTADVRVGEPEGRIGLNEVAIGLTLPWFAIALARHRLTRPAYERCTVTGELLAPADALAAGFLDRLAPAGAVLGAGQAAARELAGIDAAAHAATKLRVRAEAIADLREGFARLERGDP